MMTCIYVSVSYLHCGASLIIDVTRRVDVENVIVLRADVDEDGFHKAGGIAARFRKNIWRQISPFSSNIA
jgi:hypothetical protein